MSNKDAQFLANFQKHVPPQFKKPHSSFDVFIFLNGLHPMSFAFHSDISFKLFFIDCLKSNLISYTLIMLSS